MLATLLFYLCSDSVHLYIILSWDTAITVMQDFLVEMRFFQLALCCGNLVLSRARTLRFIILRRRWGIDLCARWDLRMGMSMMVDKSLLVSGSHATSLPSGVRSNVQPIESSLPQLMNVSLLRLYLGSSRREYAWLNICSMWDKSLDEHTGSYDKWLNDMQCPMSRL